MRGRSALIGVTDVYELFEGVQYFFSAFVIFFGLDDELGDSLDCERRPR